MKRLAMMFFVEFAVTFFTFSTVCVIAQDCVAATVQQHVCEGDPIHIAVQMKCDGEYGITYYKNGRGLDNLMKTGSNIHTITYSHRVKNMSETWMALQNSLLSDSGPYHADISCMGKQSSQEYNVTVVSCPSKADFYKPELKYKSSNMKSAGLGNGNRIDISASEHLLELYVNIPIAETPIKVTISGQGHEVTCLSSPIVKKQCWGAFKITVPQAFTVNVTLYHPMLALSQRIVEVRVTEKVLSTNSIEEKDGANGRMTPQTTPSLEPDDVTKVFNDREEHRCPSISDCTIPYAIMGCIICVWFITASSSLVYMFLRRAVSVGGKRIEYGWIMNHGGGGVDGDKEDDQCNGLPHRNRRPSTTSQRGEPVLPPTESSSLSNDTDV